MNFPPLKIAFITSKFGHQYGGAEAYGVELMRELAKRHDITVIGYTYDSDSGLNLPFIPIPLAERWPSWLRSYFFAKEAERILQTGEYDLVHSHMNGWSGDLDILHVKSVRYRWLNPANPWWQKLNARLSPRIQMYLWLEKQRVHLKPPRRTAVVSESLKQQLQQAYDTKYPFDVLTPGVHLPVPDTAVRLKSRQDLGFSDNDIVAVLVARNPLSKGLNTILDALATLYSGVFNLKLLVVGAPATLESQLHSQLQQNGLINKVLFIGQTAAISSYYQAADIALHPTFNDSFGMAPLEAMAYGLPVIMSDAKWCGFAQYATHKKNAYLLNDPRDAAELSRAINEVITNTELRLQLKQQGYELATAFSWENIAKQVESIYVDIIATRLHRGRK